MLTMQFFSFLAVAPRTTLTMGGYNFESDERWKGLFLAALRKVNVVVGWHVILNLKVYDHYCCWDDYQQAHQLTNQ